MPFPWLAAATGAASLFKIGEGKRQQKRNTELWKMNNEYNHPSAQMARLREAGLNPNLIYGDSVSGASGQSSGAPDSAPITKSSEIANSAINKYQTVRGTKLQNDNLRAQNTVMQNDATLKQAQTIKTALEADIKGLDKEVLSKTLDDVILKIQHETASTGYDAESKFSKNQENLFTAPQNKILNDANFTNKVNRLLSERQNLSNAEKLGKLRDLEIQLKEKGIKFYDSNAILKIIGQVLGLAKQN